MSFARKAALSKETLFLIFAVLCFALVGFFMAQMFRFRELSLGNAIWAGVSVIVGTLIGILYFSEKITLAQTLGIAAIVIGILVIELFPS